MIILSFSMNILVIIEGQGNVRDGLAAKEEQVALLNGAALYAVRQKIMLLVGITRDTIASHAIAKLHKTAAIKPFGAGTTPEIRHTQKGPRIASDGRDRLARIGFFLAAYLY